MQRSQTDLVNTFLSSVRSDEMRQRFETNSEAFLLVSFKVRCKRPSSALDTAIIITPLLGV
jgi:hypothetical protein